MICLALESSTNRASVAISKDGQLLCARSSYISKKHSEFLNPAIEECLQQNNISLNDIDAFAVSEGPGSFTGIRVAAGAAKTFSYLHHKPMTVINSLDLIYLQNRSAQHSDVISVINAHKNMVYFSSYENGLVTTKPCALTFPQVNDFLQNKRKKFLIAGDGYFVLFPHLNNDNQLSLHRSSENISDLDYPQAEFLSTLVGSSNNYIKTIDWKNFTPLYIRASEAEENLRNRI